MNSMSSTNFCPQKPFLVISALIPFQEPADTSVDMGIQRKQRSTLQELLESQLGGKAFGKAA